MNSIDNIKKLLEQLKIAGLLLENQITDNSITICDVQFFFETSTNEYSQHRNKNDGVILFHSSKLRRQTLQKKEISYIDINGNFFIKSNTYKIHIEKNELLKKMTKKSKQKVKLSPTNLISPNGLAFIELLFRLNNNDLKKFNSTLHFCKNYDLYQPKASQIMHRLGVKNLIECKKKLLEYSQEWWFLALENPASRRKMTSFFKISKNYYSLDKTINSLTAQSLLTKLNKHFLNEVAEGPIEVAKKFGELIDESISIWVSPLVSMELKKEFKLIPGSKEGCKSWLLATPPVSLKEEGLITHYSHKDNLGQTNILRAIWDLGFGDSRMQIASANILRRFLYEF